MEYRQNNNAMFLRAKINAVRKAIGHNAPNVPANNRILESSRQAGRVDY